jgi:uncharacterized membrane protein
MVFSKSESSFRGVGLVEFPSAGIAQPAAHAQTQGKLAALAQTARAAQAARAAAPTAVE